MKAGGHLLNYNTAKFAENGLAETEEEIISRYLVEYRRRAGMEYLLGILGR